MKVLAIDSSGLVAGVSLIEDDEIRAEYNINYKKTHSQTLLPMVSEIFGILDMDVSEVDAVAVAIGPGSFTGLRIGAATAKGIAFAIDKPVIPVPTLDAIAYNFFGNHQLICPIMDARRSQVYTGIYTFGSDNRFRVIEGGMAIGVKELVDKLEIMHKEDNRSVIFTGDGVPVYRNLIDDIMKAPHSYAPAHLSRQRAGALASLALEYFKDGRAEGADEVRPVYLRLSQAERERLEKEKAGGA